MDWSVVGGNPVPVDAGSVLGCARSLRGSARDLQRWLHDAQALFERSGAEWRGTAGATYAQSGIETVRQSAAWTVRLQQAADALVRFADDVDTLTTRATDLALRAGSYLHELHSIEIDQWYTIKLGMSGRGGGDASVERSLRVRLDAMCRLVEQVRSDFASAERRAVRAIADQLGAGRLIRPGGGLSAGRRAASAGVPVGENSGWSPVTSRLLAGMGRAQVTALFADLTPAAVRALALSDPAGVGNLDGVPLNARAIANHLLIERDRQLAVAAGDGRRLAVLDELIVSGGSVVMYEPALDHYAVLFGDQGARHVAVLVPSPGGGAGLGGWIGDAYSIWARSPGSAVIMWKGFDDPGDHGTIPEAGCDDLADEDAHKLAGFADGLALGNHQSLTVIAHGHGAAATWPALTEDGLAPADAVTLGSPEVAMPVVQGHSRSFARDGRVLD